MLKKYGTTSRIDVIKKQEAFKFDPNLIVYQLQNSGKKSMSLDELHEYVKHLGITGYSSDDMSNLIHLLHDVGIKVA